MSDNFDGVDEGDVGVTITVVGGQAPPTNDLQLHAHYADNGVFHLSGILPHNSDLNSGVATQIDEDLSLDNQPLTAELLVH